MSRLKVLARKSLPFAVLGVLVAIVAYRIAWPADEMVHDEKSRKRASSQRVVKRSALSKTLLFGDCFPSELNPFSPMRSKRIYDQGGKLCS